MSLINTKIKPFKNQVFRKTANSSKSPKKIPKAAGASSSSTRLTLLYARPNWVTLLTTTEELK